MKVKLFLWTLLLVGAYACSDDDDIEVMDVFEPLSADTLWYTQTEASQKLGLEATTQVSVQVDEDAADWCDAEITGTGSGQTLTVHCVANDQGEERYTVLRLNTEQTERKLVVYQYGSAPVLKVLQSKFTVDLDSVVVKVPVISNVEYEVIPGESWIHPLGVVKSDNADTLRLGLSSTTYPRLPAEVLLKWKEMVATITVLQVGNDTVYQPQVGELKNRIEVKDGNANYEGRGLGFKYSYDGTTTGYTSGFIPVAEDLVMTWNFKEAEQLGEMVYWPGVKDANRTLGRFHLLVREEGSSDFKEVEEPDFGYKLAPSVYRFDRNLKKVEAVQIRLSTPPGNTLVNWVFVCQEMEFFTQGFDVTSIFVDKICSGLKEGVTYERIMSIDDEFYRNIARYMYLGTYDKESRIIECKPYIDPEIQGTEHKARKWSFLDNATGITVEAGEQIALLLEETDELLQVQMMNWETCTHKQVKPDHSFDLKSGLNIITADRAGLLYILYNSDNLAGKEPVKVHIPSGKVNGFFDIERHDNAYWKVLLSKANYKYLDVKGKLVHLLFETEDFRRYCPENIERLLEVQDSVVMLEHQLSGLYRHNRMYPNRIFCKVAYDTDFSYWMYATDYHTGYSVGSISNMLSVEKLRNEDIWGFAHELGHVHQNRDITWGGMTEVSNNVFALYVQTSFGHPARLLTGNSYETACNRIGVAGISYDMPGEQDPLFMKLVPLWQLHLYFAKVLDKPEFYMDLYEEMRKEPVPSCPQMNFVELCCRAGKADLTDFFRFYGFMVPINELGIEVAQEDIDLTLEHIQAMPSLGRVPAIQYLRDDNVAMFRNIKAVEKGRVSLSGSELTLSGWKNVVAWEVYDGERLIQISMKDKFTLKSNGSAVHVKAVAADGTKVDAGLSE